MNYNSHIVNLWFTLSDMYTIKISSHVLIAIFIVCTLIILSLLVCVAYIVSRRKDARTSPCRGGLLTVAWRT